LGLAQAAQGATEKVEDMVEDEEIVAILQRMREEAERRCTEVADSRDGKKTAISKKAQETKGEATEMWALPIQERHFADVKDGSLKLVGDKDPYEES
jgi:hypothetical protein